MSTLHIGQRIKELREAKGMTRIMPHEREGKMAKPHCCPACNGAGHVSRPPWVAGDASFWADSGTATHACNACGGTGVLWEPER